ncbi:MAG TPA: transketolase [Thermoplasmata archaeon]|jgi:transketolase|nr:transketolase [Thermoplasmata archaeon]
MGEELPADLIPSLEAKALEIRRDVIRMTYWAGSGHPGGSLSVTDLLTALVFHELRIDPQRPDAPDRDRLVLSKGHAAPALYAALALRGFLPREELRTLRKLGSRLQGHVDRGKLPAIEAATGCLGQGVGMAVGMALDARLAGRTNRVYAVLGDGECQAGPTWEALMAGGHYKLENLVVLLDRNGYETDGSTEAILGIEPIADKFRAFRFHTIEIDGHDFRQILHALETARATASGPTAIVARTVKGKGVSFMENTHVWHGKAPSKAEAERALIELGIPDTQVAL